MLLFFSAFHAFSPSNWALRMLFSAVLVKQVRKMRSRNTLQIQQDIMCKHSLCDIDILQRFCVALLISLPFLLSFKLGLSDFGFGRSRDVHVLEGLLFGSFLGLGRLLRLVLLHEKHHVRHLAGICLFLLEWIRSKATLDRYEDEQADVS